VVQHCSIQATMAPTRKGFEQSIFNDLMPADHIVRNYASEPSLRIEGPAEVRDRSGFVIVALELGGAGRIEAHV